MVILYKNIYWNIVLFSFFSFRRSRNFPVIRRIWICHCILFFVWNVVFSQESTSQTSGLSGDNISVDHISTEQGLSSRAVNAIIQDKRGFIWIGTQDGLNKFDGDKFTVYKNNPLDSTSLSHNTIWSLYEDKQGVLWVGTQKGLNRFDPTTNSFKRYFHEPKNSKTLSDNVIRTMYEDKTETFWVGTAYGINKFDRKNETSTRLFPIPNDTSHTGYNFINAIIEDHQNYIWFGLGHMNIRGGGLCRFNHGDGSFTHFIHDEKNKYTLPNNWVTSFYEDRDGTLWIGTNGGICTFNKINSTFQSFLLPSNTPLALYRIFAKTICQDPNGNIWFATWGAGIFKYTKETNAFVQYTYDPLHPMSLASPTVMALFFDRTGLLWVGTWRGGLNTVATKPFVQHHAIANSLILNNGAISFLENHNGELYFGTFVNGLWKYNFEKQKLSRISLPFIQDSINVAAISSNMASNTERLSARYINSLQEDNSGIIWMLDGNNCELIKYNPVSRVSSIVFHTPVRSTGLREPINCFLLDDDETIWIGSFNKLYHIDKKGKGLSTFNSGQYPNGMSSGYVNALLRDRSGILWVGTSTGLHQFDEKSGSFKKFQHVENDSTSLSNNGIISLCEDHRGRLWIGTDDGLNRFESTTSRFTRFTASEGLAGNRIVSLQEDETGNIWLTTDVGISQVNSITGMITNYNQSNGLPTVEYNWNSSIRRKNGELLFGTNLGLLAFHPDGVKKSEYIPSIVITGVKKFNKQIPLSTSPELLREIVFTHDENVFSISFSALSYEKYAFNQYAYKLEGFDKDWVYCDTKHEALYTNLDPGTYTFHVKGSNHDNVWNEKGSSLSVIVKPAWWQTLWFTVFVWMGVVGTAAGTIRYIAVRKLKSRIAQLEQEQAIERDRARISQDLHDEVGSSLSEIAILSSLALQKPSEMGEKISEIAERATEVIDNVSEIVWAINPKNDTLDNLVARIRRYSVKYINLLNIQFDFIEPEEIPSTVVSADVRRNIFLVVKESLHNISKHSQATFVSLTIMFVKDVFSLEVTDNGIGFCIDEKTESGNGLGNMKKRIKEIGGTLSISTALNQGTKLILEYPMINQKKNVGS
jgi:ligand-binding sensor domain-containing protein/signal transduction histidine kinase